ncbi:sel1 repeat family protein [Oryzomonas japonica]|uniref:Sel1 repeat family protein n=1 Tax=Oryzomonas japonica TaxID=2603858 RepID=A0A7J4ZRU7_9BACT|nr:tetratricopeptide repeat protein [Oryzomonas japonica]KAB0665816.1 sel1 repeat family protein [Oryzomonas japonica]
MRNLVQSFIFMSLYTSLIGCAHTPGDAALRTGHPENAAMLYKAGAEQGDASAALKLGRLLEEGRVQVNIFGSPASWYERACKLGSQPACHNVGVSYEYGKNGLNRNLTKAYDFYMMAAERGYMQSQYNLASLYSNQYVQPQNDVEGLKWMLLAQDAAKRCQNVSLCQWVLSDPPGHKSKLKARLSADQVKQSESLAISWEPQKTSEPAPYVH